jgi:hypothetical protein
MKRVNTVVMHSGSSSRSHLLVALVALVAAYGCDFGGPSDPGVGIPNVTQAAPHLDEYDPSGQYTPYYTTGDMARPRYFHQSAVSQGGLAVVFGGSDERGYSGIDTVEMFDQSTWAKDSPRPDSLAGLWIDTTFEGDPLAFQNGPRMLFTVSSIGGKFLVIGGSPDLLGGTIVEKVEIFDPDLRTFESLETDMVTPRFRHATTKLNDGSILICGGQIQSTVTIINDQVAEGFPGRQQQVTVFITTPESEVYIPTEGEFRLLTIPGTEKASKLNTPRGRAGHDIARFAGPDNTLNSSDDIWLVAGGFQALSAQFAPRSKLPGSVARVTADGVTSLEFFDPLTGVFTQVGNLELGSPRINDPYIMNMGHYNDYTIDGVKGLGNVILVTHGNTDATCPITPLLDELLVANYTGFGPAQGLQFFRVEENQFGSHVQGIEYVADDLIIGRCASNPLYMPRRIASVPGVLPLQTWVIALGGCFITCCPCTVFYSGDHPTVGAGCVFDPFFNLLAVQLGLSPRNLTSTRSTSNPTGLIGSWLTLDGQLPTTELTAPPYSGTPTARWGQPQGDVRVWYRNIPLPGEDGILNTPDDRIILAGGGKSYDAPGGEPTTPSAEIFLQPGGNTTVPSP